MQRIVILMSIIIAAGTICTFAQPAYDAKRDYLWKMGYDWTPDGSVNHVIFNFHGDTMRVDTITDKGFSILYMNASVCDKNGELLFYSNGCSIADFQHELVQGGGVINAGELFSDFCGFNGADGYPGHQGMIVLPVEENTFYLFYLNAKLIYQWWLKQFMELRYAKLSYDELNGGIIANYVDNTLLVDTLAVNLTACRHANGRDWWLLSQEDNSNKFYKYIVSQYGVQSIGEQQIGLPTIWQDESVTGENIFTPDGTKFIRYTPITDLQIFDFDRCTGEFSNPIHIPIVDGTEESFSAGAVVSANSRFLYVIAYDFIYQFDLWASDIASTKDTVAIYDGFISTTGQPTRFFIGELGPDGKIYVSSQGGKAIIHVIEHPELKGDSCQVVQHKWGYLPYAIGGGLPNHPVGYRMDKVEGSPCDTILMTNNQEIKQTELAKQNELNIYPNPTNGRFMLNAPSGSEFWLYDALGRIVLKGFMPESSVRHHINIHELPNGVYYCVVRLNFKFIGGGLIIKQ